MDEYFFTMTKLYRTHRLQFLKFLLVGMLNAAIGYALFALFIALNFDSAFALAFTYIFGATANFITTGRFVFGTSNPKFLFKFLLVYVVIYVVNLSLLNTLISIGIEKMTAQAILVPFMAMLSFVLFKIFTFRGE